MRSFLTTLAIAATILVLAACAPATNPKSPSKTPVTNTPITETPPPAPYVNMGTPVWARTVSIGSDFTMFAATTTDASGNVYAGGHINGAGTFDFGNNVTVAGGYNSNNAVVVKYSTSGTPQWAKTTVSDSGYSSFSAVATDSSGNVYAAGSTGGTSTYGFGNGVTATGVYGGSNVVVVKYDTSGAAQWAKTTVSGSGQSIFAAVTIDSSGNVYAVGHIDGTSTYGFGNGVTAAGVYSGPNAVLVKYDTSGAAQWAKTVSSGSSVISFDAVTTDGSGNVYAAGSLYQAGTYDFGNGVTAAGASMESNGVVVKYSASGAAQWARTTVLGSSQNYFSAVTADGSGNVYAAGYIDGTSTYGFGNGVTAAGVFSDRNAVLVKYDTAGTPQWARTPGGAPGESEFNGLATDSSGNVYAAGVMEATGDYSFGNGVTASGAAQGVDNVLLVKYDASGTAQWAKTTTSGDQVSIFYAVTADSSGKVYAAGVLNREFMFGFGNGVTAAGAFSGYNAMLVKYE